MAWLWVLVAICEMICGVFDERGVVLGGLEAGEGWLGGVRGSGYVPRMRRTLAGMLTAASNGLQATQNDDRASPGQRSRSLCSHRALPPTTLRGRLVVDQIPIHHRLAVAIAINGPAKNLAVAVNPMRTASWSLQSPQKIVKTGSTVQQSRHQRLELRIQPWGTSKERHCNSASGLKSATRQRQVQQSES